MKNLTMSFLVLVVLLGSARAQAELVVTRYKMTGYHTDAEGKLRKMPPVRVFIQHNTQAGLLSAAAKDDCVINIGKKDFFNLWVDPYTHNCVSTKNFVVTTKEAIVDAYYQSASHYLFKDMIDEVGRMVDSGASISSSVQSDQSAMGLIRAAIRQILGATVQTQVISLKGPTTFTMSDSTGAKMVLTLNPKKTKSVEEDEE